jgi:transposase
MRYSIFGRPRHVTDAQIEEILEWHRNRETLKQIATRLGLSPATVGMVIRTKGLHYKSASPEKRDAVKAAAREHREQLERAHLIG